MREQFEGTPWDDLFKTEDGYFKLFICARTKSGKTTLLWNILKRIVTPKVKVVIFARNYETDAVWRAILKFLDDKKVNYTTSFFFKKGREFNLVKQFMDSIRDDPEADKGVKYIVIFDDQGKSMRDNEVEQLLKVNRHNRATVIVCSQMVTDMNPNSWGDLDFSILFANQPKKRLAKLHDAMALAIPFEKFMRYYKHATEEPHSFLYVGGNGLEDYRRNFTDGYVKE